MNLLALGPWAITGIVAAAVVVVILLWFILTYNSFVGAKQNGEEAFATMDVYLKKRYDLIPNLVETVKGYAKHESEVFTNVTNARARAQAAATPEEKIEADANLTRALRSVNIVAENYPQLKADANFINLQNTLNSVENEIAQSRKYYNAVAKQFNVKTAKFPSNIVAGIFHFKKMPYYEVNDPVERQNVNVKF